MDFANSRYSPFLPFHCFVQHPVSFYLWSTSQMTVKAWKQIRTSVPHCVSSTSLCKHVMVYTKATWSSAGDFPCDCDDCKAGKVKKNTHQCIHFTMKLYIISHCQQKKRISTTGRAFYFPFKWKRANAIFPKFPICSNRQNAVLHLGKR